MLSVSVCRYSNTALVLRITRGERAQFLLGRKINELELLSDIQFVKRYYPYLRWYGVER